MRSRVLDDVQLVDALVATRCRLRTSVGGMSPSLTIRMDGARSSVSEAPLRNLSGNAALNDASRGQSALASPSCFHSLAVGLRLAKAYRRRYGAGPRNIT